MNGQTLLQALEHDGIEHLQVIYHDYSGRSGAKSVPNEGFASAVERGVVFARANLDFSRRQLTRLLRDYGRRFPRSRRWLYRASCRLMEGVQACA